MIETIFVLQDKCSVFIVHHVEFIFHQFAWIVLKKKNLLLLNKNSYCIINHLMDNKHYLQLTHPLYLFGKEILLIRHSCTNSLVNDH